MQYNKNLVIGLLSIVIFLFLFVGFFAIKNKQKSASSKTTSPTVTIANTPTPEVTEENGFLEGSLSYPSEQIPSELTVCAENSQTKKVYCTGEKINSQKYTYGLGYKLSVPPGNYLIYSQMPQESYKAYYSDFVTCGLSINCKSHNPIPVEVKNNETSDKVDPQDWYNIEPSI